MNSINISIIQTANVYDHIGRKKRHSHYIEFEEKEKIRASYALTRFTVYKSACEKEQEFIDMVLNFCKNTVITHVHFTSEGIFFQSLNSKFHDNIVDGLLCRVIAGKSKRNSHSLNDENCSVLEKPRTDYIGHSYKLLHNNGNALKVSLYTISDNKGGTFLLNNSKKHGIYSVDTGKCIAKKREHIMQFNFDNGFLSTSSLVPGINFDKSFRDVEDVYNYLTAINTLSKKTIYSDAGLLTILKCIRVYKMRWPDCNKTIKAAKLMLRKNV